MNSRKTSAPSDAASFDARDMPNEQPLHRQSGVRTQAIGFKRFSFGIANRRTGATGSLPHETHDAEITDNDAIEAAG